MRFSLLPPLGSTGEGTAVSEKLRSNGWKQKNACWRPKSKKSGSSWGWRGVAYSGAPPTEMEAPPLCSCNLVPPNTTALSRSQEKVALIAAKKWRNQKRILTSVSLKMFLWREETWLDTLCAGGPNVHVPWWSQLWWLHFWTKTFLMGPDCALVQSLSSTGRWGILEQSAGMLTQR